MNIKFPTVFVLLLISSCSEESPKEVAASFLNAFKAHDFEEAAEYGTKETAKLLQQLERIEEVDDRKLFLPEGEITIVSEEIAGNTAVVYFTAGSSDVEEKLTLIKVKTGDERQWKVALSKTDVKIPVPHDSAVPDSLSLDVL